MAKNVLKLSKKNGKNRKFFFPIYIINMSGSVFYADSENFISFEFNILVFDLFRFDNFL